MAPLTKILLMFGVSQALIIGYLLWHSFLHKGGWLFWHAIPLWIAFVLTILLILRLLEVHLPFIV
jgi:hypothetical protein